MLLPLLLNLGMFGPKLGTGGIDQSEIRQRIVKPTGILHLPRKEGRKEVADRIDESLEIQAEVAGQLAKELSDGTTRLEEIRQVAIATVRQAQIDAEIGRLLKARQRTEEEEMVLLMLMAAGSA